MTVEAAIVDSPEGLQRALAASRLIRKGDDAKIERLFREILPSTTVNSLAAQLVSQRFLTRWQAEQLLQGHTQFYLGSYKLLERLGASEQSAVFRAEGPRPSTNLCVVKVFDDPRWQQPRRYSELSRVARLLSGHPHPNIQSPKRVDQIEGLTLVVSDYWEDAHDALTLTHRMASISNAAAAEIIRQAAWGLEAIHRQGITHGNLQLTDILVRDGTSAQSITVKLINAGLAPIAHAIEQGDRVAVPTKANDVDIACDLFALGCAFYQLISGRSSILTDGSLRVAARVVAKEKNSPVRDLRGKVSIELEAIIDQLFRSAAVIAAADGGTGEGSGDGFASAREVAEALAPLSSASGFSPRAAQRRPSSASAERVSTEIGAVVDPFVKVYGDLLNSGKASWWEPLLRRKVIAAAVALPLLFIGSCLWMGESVGTARIDWPVEDRTGGSMVVDGKAEPLPKTESLEITLASGSHELVLVRPGYRPYRETLAVPEGETVVVQPAWSNDRPPDIGLLRSSGEATDHQRSWASYLGVPVTETNGIGMKMVLIPPGEFMMGSTAEQISKLGQERSDRWWRDRIQSESPSHRVRINQPFRMGQTEVTSAQFAQFVSATGYRTEAETDGQGGTLGTENVPDRKRDVTWRNPGTVASGDHPVANVTHRDAQAFCDWLSKTEQKEYALPTEAEWEYACRAGTSSSWYLGESGTLLGAAAWLSSNSGRQTHVVGQKGANGFGLLDMIGNVEEWVGDSYDPDYYSRSGTDDPFREGYGKQRVARGGSFASTPATARSAHRVGYYESDRFGYLGFRVVERLSPEDLEPTPVP